MRMYDDAEITLSPVHDGDVSVDVFCRIGDRYVRFDQTCFTPGLATPSFHATTEKVPLVRISLELVVEIVPTLRRIVQALESI